MNLIPDPVPQTTSGAERHSPPAAHRIGAAIVATVVGLPQGAILSYLLFGWCYAIESGVIDDDTWANLESKMSLYGAVASMAPSLLCGWLHGYRAAAIVIAQHIVGVILGALLAMSYFRWQIVMTSYVAMQAVFPIVLFGATSLRRRRATMNASSRAGADGPPWYLWPLVPFVFTASLIFMLPLAILAVLSIPYYAVFPDHHMHVYDVRGTPH